MTVSKIRESIETVLYESPFRVPYVPGFAFEQMHDMFVGMENI